MQDSEPSAEFFLLILNLYGQQPEYKTGWFRDSWCKMTTDGRNRWIISNLDSLRTMWGELGVTGFGKFGDGLPACMQLLDEEMPANNNEHPI